MTHKELVEIAYRWLIKNGKVGFAFKELKSIASEIPDVIGFDSHQSTLIECKVSRSDFLADGKKFHKKISLGMGNWRFFCCPEGMIKIEDLPEKWGLIYVNTSGKARAVHDCRTKKVKVECANLQYYPEGFYWMKQQALENCFEVDHIAERRIFYTALRRLFIKGHVKHIYDKDYSSDKDPNALIQLNSSP